jgi:single-stranded-DNA-specific exonuclease
VSAGGINLALCDMLARAGPYGAGNPEPVLALPAHTLSFADPVGENHIRARFRSGDGKFVNAISFRSAGTPLGRALLDNRGRQMHAAGTLSVDRWQGEERVQMRLVDVAVAS